MKDVFKDGLITEDFERGSKIAFMPLRLSDITLAASKAKSPGLCGVQGDLADGGRTQRFVSGEGTPTVKFLE